MTEAFVVYLLFVILTGFTGQQQILGFANQEACLTTREELRQQGVPDISACIPLVVEGTPGGEIPEGAASMIQRPWQP
jgi:hypothetical protein